MTFLTTFMTMFIPPLISLVVREKLWGRYEATFPRMRDYGLSVLAVNVLASTVSLCLFGNEAPVEMLIGDSSAYGIKYALLASVLSFFIPCFVRWIGRYRLEVKIKKRCSISWKAIAAILAISLMAMHAMRLFGYDFWGDEAYSVLLSRMSFSDMVASTASDVHPPLYYTLLIIASRLFGDQGWVYGLVSYVPYVLITIMSLTCIWHRFGGIAAMTVILLSSLTNAGIVYSVEARMYSWALLFVTVGFLALDSIFEYDRPYDYLIFSISSLAASYTHYYAFVACSLMFLMMLVHAFMGKRSIARAVGASLLAIVGYLPWLMVLIGTFKRTSESYWIESVPGLKESLRYLFDIGDGSFTNALLALFLMVIVFYVATQAGMVDRKRDQDGKILITISDPKGNAAAWWASAGLVAILGTALVGIVVSSVFRPLFIARYLYPCAGVAWLLLGVGISHLGFMRYPAAILVFAVSVLAGMPTLKTTVSSDLSRMEVQEKTREALFEISAGDTVLTDNRFLSWSVLECYFPGVEADCFESTSLDDYAAEDYMWLVVGAEVTEDEREWAAESGCSLSEVVAGGDLGEISVWVYRISSE